MHQHPCRHRPTASLPQFVVPQFPKGHPLDMHLFLTEQPEWRAAAQAEQPIWVASDVPLAEPGVTRVFDYVYRPSEVGAGAGAGSRIAACLLRRCWLSWCQPGVNIAAVAFLFAVWFALPGGLGWLATP